MESKTRLSYWFPIVRDAGLPVPDTEIIKAGGELLNILAGKKPACFDQLLADIRAAAEKVGSPFFLRTDFTSGKHDWERTCFVTDPAKLGNHIYQIVEFSECVDIFGLPTDIWIVRKYLSVTPAFHAFRKMPITREFRLFVRDGEITHLQPYWPPEAILSPSVSDWKQRLEEISRLETLERVELELLTRKVSRALPGYWSVDWLMDSRGKWWLTDMAEGERSFVYEPGKPLQDAEV